MGTLRRSLQSIFVLVRPHGPSLPAQMLPATVPSPPWVLPPQPTPAPSPRPHPHPRPQPPPPVAPAVARDQTIDFTTAPPTPGRVGGTYRVAATATSGLAVALAIDPRSAGVCSLDGSTVSL